MIPLPEEITTVQLLDLDGDGLRDVFLAGTSAAGSREIRIYRLRPEGVLPAVPDRVVAMKADVVAWGAGDFRPDDPGVELLLLTRTSAYTMSPREESLRGNLRKLGEGPMLLDLPSATELPFWPAVADLDGDGLADALVPLEKGFLALGVAGELAQVSLGVGRDQRPLAEQEVGILRVSASAQPMADVVVPGNDPGLFEEPDVLWVSHTLPLPFLLDANGDGSLDLLYYQGGFLRVHFNTGKRPLFAEHADQEIHLAGGEEKEGFSLKTLVPLAAAGGPATDFFLVRRAKGFVLGQDWQVLFFADPFLEDQPFVRPDAILSVEAEWVRPSLVRMGPADRLAVGLSAWSLALDPLSPERTSVRHVVTVHRPVGTRGLESRAYLRRESRLQVSDFTSLSLVPDLAADLDGDGLTDFIEGAPDGSLQLFRQVQGQGAPGFEKEAWKTVPTDSLGSWTIVEDLDGDGIGDLLVFRQDLLSVYVARR